MLNYNYKKLNLAKKISNSDRSIVIEIYKYNKVGTKRIFFAAEYKEKRLSNIMYQRLGSCQADARRFMKTL